jgi:hypothetical protein
MFMRDGGLKFNFDIMSVSDFGIRVMIPHRRS